METEINLSLTIQEASWLVMILHYKIDHYCPAPTHLQIILDRLKLQAKNGGSFATEIVALKLTRDEGLSLLLLLSMQVHPVVQNPPELTSIIKKLEPHFPIELADNEDDEDEET